MILIFEAEIWVKNFQSQYGAQRKTRLKGRDILLESGENNETIPCFEKTTRWLVELGTATDWNTCFRGPHYILLLSRLKIMLMGIFAVLYSCPFMIGDAKNHYEANDENPQNSFSPPWPDQGRLKCSLLVSSQNTPVRFLWIWPK